MYCMPPLGHTCRIECCGAFFAVDDCRIVRRWQNRDDYIHKGNEGGPRPKDRRQGLYPGSEHLFHEFANCALRRHHSGPGRAGRVNGQVFV